MCVYFYYFRGYRRRVSNGGYDDLHGRISEHRHTRMIVYSRVVAEMYFGSLGAATFAAVRFQLCFLALLPNTTRICIAHIDRLNGVSKINRYRGGKCDG